MGEFRTEEMHKIRSEIREDLCEISLQALRVDLRPRQIFREAVPDRAVPFLLLRLPARRNRIGDREFQIPVLSRTAHSRVKPREPPLPLGKRKPLRLRKSRQYQIDDPENLQIRVPFLYFRSAI